MCNIVISRVTKIVLGCDKCFLDFPSPLDCCEPCRLPILLMFCLIWASYSLNPDSVFTGQTAWLPPSALTLGSSELFIHVFYFASDCCCRTFFFSFLKLISPEALPPLPMAILSWLALALLGMRETGSWNEHALRGSIPAPLHAISYANPVYSRTPMLAACSRLL